MQKIPLVLLACALGAPLVVAQSPKGYYTFIPIGPPPNGSFSPVLSGVTEIPLWTYSTTADASLGGGTFTGAMVGRSPFSKGKTTTTIPTQIIPLVITINNGSGDTVTYDPTVADSCVTPGNHTALEAVTNSPIFTNMNWTMNGVNVGNTQYIDAFQRAEFWSLVGGSPYHLILNQSTLGSQALTFGSTSGTKGPGTNYPANSIFAGQCSAVGVVNINDMDATIRALVTGPLAASVNIGTFPIFLTKNVVFAETGVSIFSSCCVLGYHSGIVVGGSNLQIYSPFSFDTSGTFGGDVSTLAHEMGEAINDPTGNNPTPNWGNLGQVVGGCQNNLEVGDPLSPGFGTPTNEFVVAGGNGLTYHMQELAFYSWFFGGPSLASGGKYSNNGSFSGFAKPCPPGGTN